MVSVEREDLPESFVSILRFKNGNKAQEIQVYKWEADSIVTALQGLSFNTVNTMYNLSGKSTVKTW